MQPLDKSAPDSDENRGLLLREQLCFPLYAASRMVVQAYRPYLDALGLTYPQYLVMLVLWEHDGASVGQIARQLCLDSPTLTLMLKKLAAAGLVRRRRQAADGRVMHNFLTAKGRQMQVAAREVPAGLACQFADEAAVMAELKPLLETLSKLLVGRL